MLRSCLRIPSVNVTTFVSMSALDSVNENIKIAPKRKEKLKTKKEKVINSDHHNFRGNKKVGF